MYTYVNILYSVNKELNWIESLNKTPFPSQKYGENNHKRNHYKCFVPRHFDYGAFLQFESSELVA